MDQLKLAIKEFVKEACVVLGDIQIPLKNWSLMKVDGDDEIGWFWMADGAPQVRPDLISLSYFFARNAPTFKSSESILQTLEQDQTLLATLRAGERNVKGWRLSEPHLKSAIWKSFLASYVEAGWIKQQKILFDDELFEAIWARHIEDLTPSAVVIEKRLLPLAGLKMTTEKLELEPGLIVRPLQPADVENWLNNHFLLLGTTFRTNEFMDIQCAIEATYQRSPEYYSVQEIVKKMESEQAEAATIVRALGTLRLVTNANISTPFEQKHSRGLLWQEMSVMFRQARNLNATRKWHSVSQFEADQTIEIWNQIKSHPKMRQYNLAFSRWSGGSARPGLDDQLIDYWIGLESLFTQDNTQELRFRAALRIAAFLGQDDAEMVKIFREVQHSYDWRSTIVHGAIGDSKKAAELNKKGQLPAVAAYTKNYLRESILRLLRSDVVLNPMKIASETETEIDFLIRLGKEGIT